MEIKTVKDLGEFACIKKISKNFIYNPKLVKLGSGDDGAVYTVPEGFDQVISTDTMVEGIHFLKSTMSPSDVGYRICTVNFSDMAAMGALPTGIVFSLALPDDLPVNWLEFCYDGIREACKKYNVNILGGDITGSKQGVVLTGTVVGIVKKISYITRSGAKEGDIVFVTGTVGDSAAGLISLLHNCENDYLKKRHTRPEPQIEWGQYFSEVGVNSLNDISDGLSRELNEIAAASNVVIQIDSTKIPISKETCELSEKLGKNSLELALDGGEDYELVGTASKEIWKKIKLKKGITAIGTVKKGIKSSVEILHKGKIKKVAAKGYDHFIKNDLYK
ncbi:thiamine-phosphate kinase [Dialister micraerophilus]|uniref:thiamine-phosphate kinase n=1 Tax=Dialister micraerophilus TaxID=309120 RepID=UPI0023F48634|nr:thiamine-phosphate kinase [Dialister micraerophilus]